MVRASLNQVLSVVQSLVGKERDGVAIILGTMILGSGSKTPLNVLSFVNAINLEIDCSNYEYFLEWELLRFGGKVMPH